MDGPHVQQHHGSDGNINTQRPIMQLYMSNGCKQLVGVSYLVFYTHLYTTFDLKHALPSNYVFNTFRNLISQ